MLADEMPADEMADEMLAELLMKCRWAANEMLLNASDEMLVDEMLLIIMIS